MLGKLLKHDFKAIFRYWWIIALSTLGSALIGGGSLRFVIDSSTRENISFTMSLLYLAAIFLTFICVLAITASLVVTFILIFYRFYKNFFTDEGYLTFTLPVSRRKLFFSKTLNAFTYTLLQIIVFILSIFIIFTIAIPTELADLSSDFIRFDLFLMGSEVTGIWNIVFALLLLIIFAFLLLYSVSFLHLCITIGSILAKKHKLLASIGTYYVINAAFSILGEIFLIIMMGVISEPLGKIAAAGTSNLSCLLITSVLVMTAAISAALAFTVYCITQHLIDKKLNLA